jgi:hypothetical protein
MWRKRVAEWRASGETAEVYSTRHRLTTSILRYWSSRFRREGEAAAPVVRLAQLVRAPPAPREEVPRGAVVIELLDVRARITIEPGTDRQTLTTVLELLDRRAGQ